MNVQCFYIKSIKKHKLDMTLCDVKTLACGSCPSGSPFQSVEDSVWAAEGFHLLNLTVLI